MAEQREESAATPAAYEIYTYIYIYSLRSLPCLLKLVGTAWMRQRGAEVENTSKVPECCSRKLFHVTVGQSFSG